MNYRDKELWVQLSDWEIFNNWMVQQINEAFTAKLFHLLNIVRLEVNHFRWPGTSYECVVELILEQRNDMQ